MKWRARERETADSEVLGRNWVAAGRKEEAMGRKGGAMGRKEEAAGRKGEIVAW